jgi:hypothetical protein
MPDTLTSFSPVVYQILPYFSNVSGVTDLTATYYDSGNNVLNTAVFDNSTFVANKLRQFNVQNSSLLTDHVLLTGAFSLRINYQCSKYTPHTLVWLNPFGGYESQQFGFVSKKIIDVTKRGYSQKPYKISDAGVVSYLDGGSVFYGGKKNFISTAKVKLRLTSHLLNDEEYTWLADLFISPQIYLYVSSVGFVPVNLSGQYEYRTYLNSRLTPLEFEVEMDDYNSQLL